jgi:hypothetical protein
MDHDDRRARAQIPRQLPFREKWRIAVAHVRTVLAAGFTLEPSSPTRHGEIAQFRTALERQGVPDVVAVPYLSAPGLTADTPCESLAALACSLAPAMWRAFDGVTAPKGR